MTNSDNDYSKKIKWLETTESEIVNSGFADYVKNYQKRLVDAGSIEPLELEGPQASATSSIVELSTKNLSSESVAAPAISNTNVSAVDDVGFNRFLDEWTINASKEARYQWLKMSKRDRASYANTNDLVSSASVTPDSTVSPSAKRLLFGKASSGSIRRACDKNCANPTKRRTCKPKIPKAKACDRAKKANKRPKPLVAKSCPRPKTEKQKSGRKCLKPMVPSSPRKPDVPKYD